jgi:hypothetical protein
MQRHVSKKFGFLFHTNNADRYSPSCPLLSCICSFRVRGRPKPRSSKAIPWLSSHSSGRSHSCSTYAPMPSTYPDLSLTEPQIFVTPLFVPQFYLYWAHLSVPYPNILVVTHFQRSRSPNYCLLARNIRPPSPRILRLGRCRKYCERSERL